MAISLDADNIDLKTHIELVRLGLDQERLKLEQQQSRLERSLFTKHFPALISAAIAFAGLTLSGANIWVAYVSKAKDIDIAARKDLRDFVATNHATIFGQDRIAAEQIRNAMRVTFPENLLATVLLQIAENVPPTTRDLFASQKLNARTVRGRVGTWGGLADNVVSPSEQLALIKPSEVSKFSQYFLPEQPPGTTGLARRLNPKSYYISARWNYSDTDSEYLKTHLVTVTNPQIPGRSFQAQPVDWGPPSSSGRIADLSPGLADALGVQINGEVILTIP